jgi:acetyl-CoA carboxylase biotin carboxyl carrier protein
VTTPLPGTFYRAPRPGAAPFAEVGTMVEPDTVVAIVETMKLMNPVHAGTRGRVAEILVANAEPVAQGAVLLRIEPALPGRVPEGQPSPGGTPPRGMPGGQASAPGMPG